MSDGGSRVIDPRIVEYFNMPESERMLKTSSPEFDGPAEAVVLVKSGALSLTAPVQPEQKKKRGFFSFFRRKPTAETKKKLAPPQLFECGMCNEELEANVLYSHWQTHTTAVNDDPKMVGNGGPGRSATKQRSMVFIVRRSPYTVEYQARFNEESMTAQYFALTIINLKQQRPGMRFQYVPVCIGGSGEYLKTLLIIAEWDEE